MPNDSSIPAAKIRKTPFVWPFFALAMMLLLIFWGANIWLTRWQGGDADPEEAQRAEFRAKTLAELRANDAKKLGSYAWVDRAKGSVQIPITEAMELVVSEINNAKPHAAYPGTTPPPPPEPTASPDPAKP
jgi:hypothetical protein